MIIEGKEYTLKIIDGNMYAVSKDDKVDIGMTYECFLECYEEAKSIMGYTPDECMYDMISTLIVNKN